MCLYLLFFIGHMVLPYNHFFGYPNLVMEVPYEIIGTYINHFTNRI